MDYFEKLIEYLRLLQSVKQVNVDNEEMETKLNNKILSVCDCIEKELNIKKLN